MSSEKKKEEKQIMDMSGRCVGLVLTSHPSWQLPYNWSIFAPGRTAELLGLRLLSLKSFA